MKYIPLSKINGAFGPINIAMQPAPPVHLAFPEEYMAISPVTTIACRPEVRKHESICQKKPCIYRKSD